MNILNFLTTFYMLVIFIRIILTWFRGNFQVPEILCRITDPYLNWFRRFQFLRIGYMDFSPIAALMILSLVNRIFSTLARYGTITLGIIGAMILQALWSALSFLLIFMIIVLVLRLIAYLANLNIYGTFWRMVDTFSQPVLYRITRILFRGRIANFLTSLVIAIAILTLSSIILGILVSILTNILVRLPV